MLSHLGSAPNVQFTVLKHNIVTDIQTRYAGIGAAINVTLYNSDDLVMDSNNTAFTPLTTTAVS